jgi:hypothetical protein
MMSIKQFATISLAEWHASQTRGLTAIIANRPYLVTTRRSTDDRAYQPVAILADETPRTS